MRRRPALLWTLAAIAGIVLVAGMTVAASRLSTLQVGLSSEPLQAGRSLAPAATRTPARKPRPKHRPAATATRTPAPTAPPAPTATIVVPAPTATAAPPPPVPTVDDHGGRRGSDDGSSGHRGSDD